MKRKPNIIDVLLITFLCAVVVFFAFKFTANLFINDSRSKMIDVTCTIRVGGIMDITADAIPQNGTIYDEDGFKFGTVRNKVVNNSEVVKLKADGQYIKTHIPDRYDVLLTVDTQAIVKDVGYYIDGKVNLGSGSTVSLKAKNVVFSAYVVDVKEK